MEAKDIKRIQDIQRKALGNVARMVTLADTMAHRIKSVTKMYGRLEASIQELGPDHPVTKVFRRHYNYMTGEKSNITPVTLENDETKNNSIYFPTASAVALWNWEITGQISDGMWENTMPYDHWKPWCDMEAHLGNPRYKTNQRVVKDGYALGSLKTYVGDRMLVYGQFGKAVGDDILKMGNEVRTVIEEFPAEVFNLEEFKTKMINNKEWRNKEYYWKGLEQKHVDAFYNTVYTEKDLNNDLKNIKTAMKNQQY
jgi:hypothetical protein